MARKRNRRTRSRTSRVKISQTRKLSRRSLGFVPVRRLRVNKMLKSQRNISRLSTAKRRKRLTTRSLRNMRNREVLSRAARINSKPSLQNAFKTPTLTTKKQTICQKRRSRREIIFATRKAGKSGQKRPVRRNPQIICRRK